jgi:hypothetical protein
MRMLFPCLIVLFAYTALHAQSLEIMDMKQPSVRCDYLIIFPESFRSQALALAAYRNSSVYDDVQNAMAVSVNAILSQFPVPDTLPRSFSIWQGLKYASNQWTKKPNYVVLLGDDSVFVSGFDTLCAPPKSVGLMPTFYFDADTNHLAKDTIVEYSDYFFQTIEDSQPPVKRMYGNRWDYSDWEVRVPAFALGRIPAQSSQQCQQYIDKLIRYEAQNKKGAWMNHISLAADDAFQLVDDSIVRDPLGHDHLEGVESLAEPCFKGFFLDKTYLSSFTKNSEKIHESARTRFFDIEGQGVRWSVFFGHGHPYLLTDEKFLRSTDFTLFRNDTAPTVFFAFSCSNGYFLRDSALQMAKSFLFKPTGGCIAYFAATTESYSENNKQLAKAIFGQAGETDSLSLGMAVMKANVIVRDENMRFYEILGDPAITFRKKRTPITTTAFAATGGAVTVTTTVQLSSPASPLFFSYRISAVDSVKCLDDSAISYVKDSVVSSREGSASGPVAAEIPSSLRNKKIRFCMYVWNNETEARFDTVFTPSSAALAVRDARPQQCASVRQLRRGVFSVALSMPGSPGTVRVALVNTRGQMVRAADAPCRDGRAVFDVSREGISDGKYFLRIMAGSRLFSESVCLMR